MFYALFIACTANLTVVGPPSSDIYIVKDQRPKKDSKPVVYECNDKGQVSCEVPYFAWNKFYYGVYDNNFHRADMMSHEVKLGPTVAGLFFIWPAFVWAYGPSEREVRVERTNN